MSKADRNQQAYNQNNPPHSSSRYSDEDFCSESELPKTYNEYKARK